MSDRSASSSQNTPFRQSTGLTASAAVLLLLLLAVPIYALSRLTPSIDWRVLVGAPAALSLFAFFAYRSDKHRAERGAWRIPESTLQLTALLGGWPGAFLAQRTFRHKTSKLSFQIVYWAIVATHELAALDSLTGWSYTQQAWRFIKAHSS